MLLMLHKLCMLWACTSTDAQHLRSCTYRPAGYFSHGTGLGNCINQGFVVGITRFLEELPEEWPLGYYEGVK